MRRIIFDAAAVGDIAAIRDYIERDSKSAATHVVRGIMRGVAQLGVFPRSGRLGKINGTFELVIRGLPNLAVYTITGNRVEILAVVHMAQESSRRTIR